MSGRRIGERTVGAALALTLVVGVLVAGAAGAAPGDPVGSAMPGPVGQVESFDYSLGQPDRIVVGGDASAWFHIDSGVGRMHPDGTYEVVPVGGDLLAPAPDGGIWAVSGYGTIGRVAVDGTVSYPTLIDDGGGGFEDLIDATSDADGNLWLTTAGGYEFPPSIVRVTTDGVISNFPDPRLGFVSGITAGSDGTIWFLDQNRLGRITPGGVVSHVALPAPYYLDLAAGPDGNIWLAGSNTVLRVTPTGTVTSFTAPGLAASDIVAGADGKLWFRNTSGPRLGTITTAGAITLLAATGLEAAGSLAAGADGLWFADRQRGAVGRIAPDGTVTDLPPPNIRGLAGITTGPDGNLWVTSPSTDTVGRVTDDGDLTVFGGIDDPTGIATGPDGNLWVTSKPTHTVSRLTPSGSVTTFSGASIKRPDAIVLGGDGNLWFLNEGTGTLGRITPAGVVSSFPASGLNQLLAGPNDLEAGPDGTLWFTSAADDRIGHATMTGAITWFTDPDIVHPRSIAVNPYGGVWFSYDQPGSGGFGLGRLLADGTAEAVNGPSGYDPGNVTAGTDGRIWIHGGRYAPDGTGIGVPGISLLGTPVTVGPDGTMWNAGTSRLSREKAVETGAPRYPQAIAGKERVVVDWRPPAEPTGPITGYLATATPSGATCTTAGALTCTISGLPAHQVQTVTIQAVTASGPGPSSTAPGYPVPWSGSSYHPLSPHRILDSRLPAVGFTGPVVTGTPRSLQVTGLGGPSDVPASASAVVMNVTVTDSTAASFLTVYPSGTTKPNASNLNFAAGQVIPNLVTVKLGTGGKVDLATAVGSTNVVADVVGYYDDGTGAGDRFTPLTPARLFDSRDAAVALTAGTPRDVLVENPIDTTYVPPATATAAVVNITVTAGDAQSFVTAWPSDEAQPDVSNLNFMPGQTFPNLAIVKLSVDGKIRLANAVGSVHVIVDVVGYFDPTGGARFHPVAPNRILDTRTGTGLTGKQGPGQTRALAVGGVATTGVPADATGMVANVTVADATLESLVKVWPPDPGGPPGSSNLNFGASQVIPNLVTTGLAADGTVNVYNELGETHLIADLVGWYAPY